MVDVGGKTVTAREARARARLRVSAEAISALTSGTGAKGDAIAVARVAGIQAAKRTAEWIPLCHPLPLDQVAITFTVAPRTGEITIESRARTRARTGVEMEALVAAAAAALALYDMLKAVDRTIVIEELLVLEKRGGRSGHFRHPRAQAATPKSARTRPRASVASGRRRPPGGTR
jgi:cyclic pyranopterin phosphate synthase